MVGLVKKKGEVMKKHFSKFIQITAVLGSILAPVLCNAGDHQIQTMPEGEAEATVSAGNLPIHYSPCALEKKNLKDCEASDDEDKDCLIQATALIQCEEKAVRKAMDQNEPPKPYGGN